ncbi:MAG: AbrB/MazE/SpoVT family DNA-binding domain-containing protein [Methanophagales archaeon]|nr:AbrB/MazE/SpoVT family DNA-binding domain-containing protein [Methanophagales archaeon]
MELEVVKITKKGQATIPKYLRKKFGFKDRAIVVESREGVLLKPFPDISEEKGSLREIFKGVTAKEVIEEAREADIRKEKVLERR